METFTYYFYYLSSVYYGFPLVIRIALFVTMVLCSLYFFFGSRLFFSNYRQNCLEKNREEIYNKYKASIEEILNSQENLTQEEMSSIIGGNSKLYRKNYIKEQITDLIISLKNHYGEDINPSNYNELLSFFDLYEYWNSQILRGNNVAKMNGMRKLHDLGGDHYCGIMSRYLYHRNTNLRKLARIEYIKLGEDNSYKFLEEGFDEHFTKLDEVRLHEAFKDRDNKNKLPLLTRFIEGEKDERYKQFLIKEIGYFCQYSSAEYLLSLLSKEKDAGTKREIIKTLGVFKFKPALKKIQEEYNFSTVSTQEVIIDSIVNIGGNESLKILNSIYHNENNNEMSKKVEFAIEKSKQTKNILELPKERARRTDRVYYSHSF